MSIPPSPDQKEPAAIPGQRQVELISGRDDYRVLITVDDAGVYRVYDEFWNTWWWPDDGQCFWCRQGPYSLVDSLEAARELVSGLVREHERKEED